MYRNSNTSWASDQVWVHDFSITTRTHNVLIVILDLKVSQIPLYELWTPGIVEDEVSSFGYADGYVANLV